MLMHETGELEKKLNVEAKMGLGLGLEQLQ